MRGFRIACENNFLIASVLGVCDSNRIAHPNDIARFGPLMPGKQPQTAGETNKTIKTTVLQMFGCFPALLVRTQWSSCAAQQHLVQKKR